MVICDVLWFFVVLGGSWWFLDGSLWFLVVLDNFWWFLVVLGVLGDSW